MTCSSVEEWFIFSIQTSFQTQDLSSLFLGAEFLSGQQAPASERVLEMSEQAMSNPALGKSLYQNNAP